MQPSPKLPTPEATDSQEVALALEEAIALWATGKKDESVAAVTRAANGAERAGATPRAAALRAAADELTNAGASARPAGPGAVDGPGRSAPPAPRVASHAPPPPSARHAAEARNASRPPPATSAMKSAPPANVVPSPPAVPAAPPPPEHTASPPAAASANGHANGAGALHVWVRASARDPSLLLVRLLPDGEAAPPGSYEAYLSPANEGIDLRAPKH